MHASIHLETHVLNLIKRHHIHVSELIRIFCGSWFFNALMIVINLYCGDLLRVLRFDFCINKNWKGRKT